MADLLAIGAEEIDALDGLFDSLAVQDPASQLADADSQELLILALDLQPTGLVLGQALRRLFGLLLVAPQAEALLLGRPALCGLLLGPRHQSAPLGAAFQKKPEPAPIQSVLIGEPEFKLAASR